MYCPECGAPVSERAKFCRYCGKEIPGKAETDFTAAGRRERAENTAYYWYETNPSGARTAPQPARSAENAGRASSIWAWMLATVPGFVSIVLSEMDYPIAAVVAAIALNIVFLMLDVKELRSCGREPGSWMYLGFVVVPAYLFVRAAKTDKNFGPGIVWCAIQIQSFVLFGLPGAFLL